MTRLFDELRQRVVDLFGDLGSRPLYLFCLLVAANAVALPYSNFVHDANLYGVQVLNRVDPGRFANDLYFQYGSQDKYSVFSQLAAPLAAWLGLSATFLVLYLASNALFLFALQRFVRAIIKDPTVSVLALLFMAVTEIPFGGLRVFHVNEPFLTPRLATNALVLLGLERLLAGRLVQAWGLVLIALPLHPLMAFPGALILAGWMVLTRMQTKSFLVLLFLAGLAAAVFLNDRPLASRWLGPMDNTWRESVHRVNPYNFPLDWTVGDWLRIILSFAVVLSAAWYLREDASIYRLLVAIAGTAAAGLAAGTIACFLPYALPFQGQPYRWIWPLELVLYPLGILIARRLGAAQHTVTRLASLGLLAYLNDTSWDGPMLLLASSAALFGMVAWRGIPARPHVADWMVRSATFALVLALSLGTALKLGLVVSLRRQLADLLEPVEVLQLMIALIDPLCRLALVVLAAVLFARLAGVRWQFGLGCFGASLASLLIFFVLPQTRFYVEKYGLHNADECFIAEFLAKHSASTRLPTVYWPTGKIRYLWLDLRVPSYFHIHQIVGNLFSFGNAAEGARRAQIVKRFELERWRKESLLVPPEQMRRVLTAYQASEDEPPPQLSDLVRLCQEKQLDLAVLPQEFPGLYAASNGQWFIYDCRAIRARSNSSPYDPSTPAP
jgi:hypothetical protein